MKKKTAFLAVLIPALLICMIAFFKPLSLSDIAGEKNQLKMILNEYKIRDGEPYIDSTDYQAITAEQKSAVLSLLNEYPYKGHSAHHFQTVLFPAWVVRPFPSMCMMMFPSLAAFLLHHPGKLRLMIKFIV